MIISLPRFSIVALCFFLFSGSVTEAEEPEKKRITLQELNSEFDLIGGLGQPVFTVLKIKGVLFDGDETRVKANAGRILLKVREVGGRILKEPVLIPFGVFQTGTVSVNGVALENLNYRNRDKVVGKTIECAGYELISGRGVPASAFDHVASIATTGPHFSSEFVILKLLP